jgi:hypothetical protein
MNNNSEKSGQETPKSNKKDKNNTFNVIKEGWDKLSLEYDVIVKNVKSFNDTLDEEHKKNFKSIILSLEKFKDDFKNVIFNISLSLGNITSNSPNKNNNEININLSVKNSYDNIYSEFLELESLTKKLLVNQKKIQKNRNNHFQNIEKKLQGFLEEINEFDFKKINKNMIKFYDENNKLNLNNMNNNEKINFLLQKNNIVEKYNPCDFNFSESENNKNDEEIEIDDEYEIENYMEKDEINNKKKNNNDLNGNKDNTENNLLSTEEKDIKLLNDIINMDGLNQDDAVKYIQKLIKNEKK